MPSASVQVQTVLYKMDKASLVRALDSVENAVRVERARTDGGARAGELTVVHGDASPEPTFTPEEAEAVRRRYEGSFSYVYRFFDENTGTSKGHNLMFEGCESDYLVVENPDVQWSPRFLERMLAPFGRDDLRVGLVEARQVPIENPTFFNQLTMEKSWCTGACFMARSDVYREVGGFDADTFFMYCDDVDLSWRIRLAGYSLIYEPRAPVFHPKHLNGMARWETTPAEAYYSSEALLLMCYKWSYNARLERLLKDFQTDGDEIHGRVAKAFLERREQGRLPEQLDPGHKVADINDSGYASRRYAL